MVKSMTGYGRAREMRSGRDITVEVRSVNNRYLDCTVKLPRAYIFAEDAIKTRVQKAISRGKVDVFVTIDTSAADVAVVQVNEGLAKGYYDALTLLKERFTLPGEITPEVLARFPDVLTVTKAEAPPPSPAPGRRSRPLRRNSPGRSCPRPAPPARPCPQIPFRCAAPAAAPRWSCRRRAYR